VELQFREKEEACRELMNTLKFKSALCQDLESQLAKVGLALFPPCKLNYLMT